MNHFFREAEVVSGQGLNIKKFYEGFKHFVHHVFCPYLKIKKKNGPHNLVEIDWAYTTPRRKQK